MEVVGNELLSMLERDRKLSVVNHGGYTKMIALIGQIDMNTLNRNVKFTVLKNPVSKIMKKHAKSEKRKTSLLFYVKQA